MRREAIDLWLSIGSTYSFLTVMRMRKVEVKYGVKFNLRPFSVREIMVEMDNIPFADKPVKYDYMWRDIERRAELFGIKAKVPAPYPLTGFDLANQVAVLGMQQGWGRDYVLATYQLWFQRGEPAGQEPNLSKSLKSIGLEPEEVIAAALSDETVAAYKLATSQARQLGIFGAPSFVTRGEMFWGDDRLEEAVLWHLERRLED